MTTLSKTPRKPAISKLRKSGNLETHEQRALRTALESIAATNGIWTMGPIPNVLVPLMHLQMIGDVEQVAGLRPLMLCGYSVAAYLSANGIFGAFEEAQS